MENIISLLQAFNLDILEAGITGIFVLAFGYWLGNKKVKKATEEIYKLQREVLDLNAELLYGKNETPVIGITHEPLKSSKIAK
jgi:hypothetical protein